jgi:lysophospholipase L1-like esterase
VAVIGDAYMSGTDPKNPDLGMADELAGDLGMNLSNFSAGGTGYLREGPPGHHNYRIQARKAVKTDADLVVVYGGSQDWINIVVEENRTRADLKRAVRQVFDTLKAGPTKDIVVVGPIWPAFPIDPGAYKVRDVIKAEAEAADLPFIDPIEEQWLTPANDQEYLGVDGLRPSEAGKVYFSAKIAKAIDKLFDDIGPLDLEK